MTEANDGSRNISDRVAKLGGVTLDIIDRSIGARMLDFADQLEELANRKGELSTADLLALLRQQGETLKETYHRGGRPEPG